MPPQVQKLLEPPEAVRSKKNPSPELFEGAKKLSCQRLDFGLWLPQLRGRKFLLFSSTKLVIMLQQPWEAGTLTVSYLTTVDLSCLTWIWEDLDLPSMVPGGVKEIIHGTEWALDGKLCYEGWWMAIMKFYFHPADGRRCICKWKDFVKFIPRNAP